MTETLSKAWSLFDAGNYTDAETLYKECYAKIPSTDHDNYWQVLMGLIYAESFLEHFAEARTYASQLISCAIDHEEKHMLSALDFAEKSNDLISIGCAYRGLGEILKASEKAEDASVYFEKAITAFQKAGDTYGVEEVKELMSK